MAAIRSFRTPEVCCKPYNLEVATGDFRANKKKGVIHSVADWKTKHIQSWNGKQLVNTMDVSKNGGTQQPWVFLLKMIILGCFGGTPIFGNTLIYVYHERYSKVMI